MKTSRKIILVLTLVMLLTSGVFARSNARIMINNEYTDMEVIVNKGHSLVPLRAIFNALDIENVNWHHKERMVTAQEGDINIALTIDSQDAIINGREVELKQAPIIANSKTYVPVRFIAETFGIPVDWDQASQTVLINSQIKDNTKSTPQYELYRRPMAEYGGKIVYVDREVDREKVSVNLKSMDPKTNKVEALTNFDNIDSYRFVNYKDEILFFKDYAFLEDNKIIEKENLIQGVDINTGKLRDLNINHLDLFKANKSMLDQYNKLLKDGYKPMYRLNMYIDDMAIAKDSLYITGTYYNSFSKAGIEEKYLNEKSLYRIDLKTNKIEHIASFSDDYLLEKFDFTDGKIIDIDENNLYFYGKTTKGQHMVLSLNHKKRELKKHVLLDSQEYSNGYFVSNNKLYLVLFKAGFEDSYMLELDLKTKKTRLVNELPAKPEYTVRIEGDRIYQSKFEADNIINFVYDTETKKTSKISLASNESLNNIIFIEFNGKSYGLLEGDNNQYIKVIN